MVLNGTIKHGTINERRDKTHIDDSPVYRLRELREKINDWIYSHLNEFISISAAIRDKYELRGPEQENRRRRRR